MVTGELLGFIAGGIGISSNIPQIVSIRRLKHTNGISLTTWMLTYLYSSFWFTYGVKTHSPSQYVTNGLTIVFATWILWAIMGKELKTYLILLGLPILVTIISILIPLAVLSPILFGSSLISFTQVVKSLHSRRHKIATAVSIHRLVMAQVASGLWLTYGLMGGRTIVIISTTLTIVANTLILFVELRNKQENDKSRQEI